MPKKINGYGHSPKIHKGVYQIGGTVTGRIQCKSPNYARLPSPKYQLQWTTGQILELQNAIFEREREWHPVPRRREAIEHTRRKLGL